MIPLSAAAEAALLKLTLYYAGLGRDGAIDRVIASLSEACDRYESNRGAFFNAPRPYPKLAALGFRWTKQGSYWIAFEETDGNSFVAGIFHEAADIPNRV